MRVQFTIVTWYSHSNVVRKKRYSSLASEREWTKAQIWGRQQFRAVVRCGAERQYKHAQTTATQTGGPNWTRAFRVDRSVRRTKVPKGHCRTGKTVDSVCMCLSRCARYIASLKEIAQTSRFVIRTCSVVKVHIRFVNDQLPWISFTFVQPAVSVL